MRPWILFLLVLGLLYTVPIVAQEMDLPISPANVLGAYPSTQPAHRLIPPVTGTPTGRGTTVPEPEPPSEPTPIQFYGEEISSSKIIFMIDVSGSMFLEDRLQQAKVELSNSINALDAQIKFNVYSFTSHFALYITTPFEGPVFATQSNKGLATTWLMALFPAGGTPTGVAVVEVVGLDSPDDLILLTDGAPNTPYFVNHLQIATEACNNNNTKCHTFGIQDTGQFTTFLVTLSANTGGVYRHLPTP